MKTDTYTKTLLYKDTLTGAEVYSSDDKTKDTDIDELDLFDMLDEEEEE